MTLLLALACAHTPAPVAAPAPPPEVAMSHPGTITFVDHTKGTTTERPVAEVPDAIAWYGAGADRVPVTRVEAADRGGALEITRYGADGALLDVTVGGR